MFMLKSHFPSAYVESVFSINYARLYDLGYRALIFDIDNTLVHHGDPSNDKIDDLFKEIKEIGFKCFILSNNSSERIERFLINIDLPYIAEANKPSVKGYEEAILCLEEGKDKTLFIGDQLFTDILGANRAGIASILVKFIRLPNLKKIGKRRQLEKIILLFYKKNKKCNSLGDIEIK